MIQFRPVMILVHPPSNDWLSVCCYHIGKWAGLELSGAAHCSLVVGDTVYELILSGIISYKYSFYTREVLDSTVLFLTEREYELLLQNVVVATNCDVRIRFVDLIKMALGRKPSGLICTSFIEVLLNEKCISHPLPFDLLKRYRLVGVLRICRILSVMHHAPSAEAGII